MDAVPFTTICHADWTDGGGNPINGAHSTTVCLSAIDGLKLCFITPIKQSPLCLVYESKSLFKETSFETNSCLGTT